MWNSSMAVIELTVRYYLYIEKECTRRKNEETHATRVTGIVSTNVIGARDIRRSSRRSHNWCAVNELVYQCNELVRDASRCDG